MSLETIVSKMIAANEPEATIAKVIKHYNQINIPPLKQVEEVETISVEETPKCEGDGMVWSEAEGKCIPEQPKVSEIELTPTTPVTPIPTAEVEQEQIETNTSQNTLNIPDQNAWKKHLAQEDDFYRVPTQPKSSYYPTEEGNTETITKTIKVKGPNRPPSLNFPGGLPTWTEKEVDTNITIEQHQKDKNDLHDRLVSGLLNPQVLEILTQDKGITDPLSININKLQDKILEQVKKEFPDGYKSIKPAQLDKMALDAIDLVTQQKNIAWKKKLQEQALIDGDEDEIINTEKLIVIEGLSKAEKEIYRLQQIISDPNASPEVKKKAEEELKKGTQRKSRTGKYLGTYTPFINPVTGTHLSSVEAEAAEAQGAKMIDTEAAQQKYIQEIENQEFGYPELKAAFDENLLTTAKLKEFSGRTGNYIINNKTIQKFLSDAGYKHEMDINGNLVYKNVPFGEIAKWGHLLTDNMMNKIAAGTDVEGSGEIEVVKENGDIKDIDPQELLIFNDQVANIYGKQDVLKDLVLLNKLPQTSGYGKYIEKPLRIFREGLGVDSTRDLSLTERMTKDLIGEVLPEAGISIGDEKDGRIAKELEVGFGESLAEAAAGAGAFVIQLAALDKFNPLKMKKYAKLLNKWSKGTPLEKTYAGLLRDGMEELKFKVAGGDWGEGAAFSRASRLIPSFSSGIKGKYGFNQVKVGLDHLHSGVSMVAGGQGSKVVRGVLEDITNKKEFETFLDQNYPDWDTAQKDVLKEFILGGLMKGMHGKARDYYTTNKLTQTRRIAIKKMREGELKTAKIFLNRNKKGEGKYQTELEVREEDIALKEARKKINRNVEIVQEIDTRLYQLNDMGRTITEKDVNKTLEAHGYERGKDVEVKIIKEADAEANGLVNGVKAEWGKGKNGKINEIKILETGSTAELLHEINHETKFQQFNDAPIAIKKQLLPYLKDIYKKIETGEGRNLWDDLNHLKKEENWNNDRYFTEVIAYGVEHLNKPGNYKEHVAKNIFELAKNKLVDFTKEKFGNKFDLFKGKPVRNKDIPRMLSEFSRGDTGVFDMLTEGVSKPGPKNNERIGESVKLSSRNLKKLESANEKTRKVLDLVGKSPEFLDIIEGKKSITIDGKKIGQKEVFELISDKIARTSYRFGKDGVNLNDFKKFNLADYVAETIASIIPDIKRYDNTRNDSWNNQLGSIIKPRINRSVKKAWGVEGESIHEIGLDIIDPTENIGETMSLGKGSSVSREIIAGGNEKLTDGVQKLMNSIDKIVSGDTKVPSIKNALSKKIKDFAKNKEGNQIVSDLKTKFKGNNFIDYINNNTKEALSTFLANNNFKKGQNRDTWNTLTEAEFKDYFKGTDIKNNTNLTNPQKSNAIATRKTAFINAYAKNIIREKLDRLDIANEISDRLNSNELGDLKKNYKDIAGKTLTDKKIVNYIEWAAGRNMKIDPNLVEAAQLTYGKYMIAESELSRTGTTGVREKTIGINDLIKAEYETGMPQWAYQMIKSKKELDFKKNKEGQDKWMEGLETFFGDYLPFLEGQPGTLAKAQNTAVPSTVGKKGMAGVIGKAVEKALLKPGNKMSPELKEAWTTFLKENPNINNTYTTKFTNAAKQAYERGLTKNGEVPKETIKELTEAFNFPKTKAIMKFRQLFEKSLNEYVNEGTVLDSDGNPIPVKRGSQEWKNRLGTVTRMLINQGSIWSAGMRRLANPKWVYIPPKGKAGVPFKVEHMKSMNEYSGHLLEGLYNNNLKFNKDFTSAYGPTEVFNIMDNAGKTNTSGIMRLAQNQELAKNMYDISTLKAPNGPKNMLQAMLGKKTKDSKLFEEFLKNSENTLNSNKKEAGIFGVKGSLKDIKTSNQFVKWVKANADAQYSMDRLQSQDLTLEKGFNQILEESKGVKADAVYSESRAGKLAKGKGKYKFFVPYSAEDFLGLTYATLGKGKQGESHQKWYQDNLIDPYNKGVTEFEVAKQAAMTDWRYLKSQIKNTSSNLKKKAVRDFTNEEALRVYMWEKSGVTPEGLSKKDVKALVKNVNASPELKGFADQIASITKGDGYPMPQSDWMAGTITTDLINHVNTVSRATYLQNWQRNVDAIYTPNTFNKLRATFGESYVESLKDALYRMKTGRNRATGANKLTNGWLNWVNDSVGTVMFLNQRSALLQTISSINYMNWTDNNPAKAAMAFGNQKQFWKDFSYLFNSDFLKQRRSGLKTDVNADEIASTAATSQNKARAAASWILKQGFLPTQMADSFAISMGGASFYRNRVNRYKKEGVSEKEAQETAFNDFRKLSEESQQSSDPSRISSQQSGPLGRLVLAFANTPMQYTRLTKRAAQDLINGRGDWKTNVSRISYYGAVQNMIFAGLQQAMFGIAFDPSEEGDDSKLGQFKKDRENQATGKIINSTADMFLRGSGVSGAFVAAIKNIVLEANRQSGKKRSDYERVADKFFTFSPVIDSKFRKLQSAGRTFTYKQELKKIQERGIAVDNPALMAVSQVLSAYTNVPLDRAIKKINNVKTATEEETQLWQKIALLMGYGEWELGITNRKTDEARAKAKKEKEETKKFKNLQKYIDKENKKTPIKALEAGVLGEANKDGSIVVANGLSKEKRK